MSEEFSRTQRVSEVIRRELSVPLQIQSRDHHLGLVTITGVDVTSDFKHAKVYVTCIGGSMQPAEVIKFLNEHSGPFRHHLSINMKLRTIPRLRFVFDESVENGVRLYALIDSLSKPDSDSED